MTKLAGGEVYDLTRKSFSEKPIVALQIPEYSH